MTTTFVTDVCEPKEACVDLHVECVAIVHQAGVPVCVRWESVDAHPGMTILRYSNPDTQLRKKCKKKTLKKEFKPRICKV